MLLSRALSAFFIFFPVALSSKEASNLRFNKLLRKSPRESSRFVEEGLVDEVICQLMSGKEVMVYVVRCGMDIRCAKVYKEIDKRSFRHNAAHHSWRFIEIRCAGKDGLVIIDLPQAVDAASNSSAHSLLLRDVDNLTRYFGCFAPELLKTDYGNEIWFL